MSQMNTPATPSSDHTAMAPYWRMVDAILGGAGAMRAAGKAFLPQFKNESEDAYKVRLEHAKFTNIFRDIAENLAQRPFGKEVQIGGDAPDQIKAIVEDVDGEGNHLHVFAGDVMFNGITHALDWILVDYTAGVPESATLADEARIGARPYWVRIPATHVLAAYSAKVGGREQFVHVRIRADEMVRDGYGERTVERIKVFDRPEADGTYGPATWQLFERVKTETKEEWVAINDPAPITIGVIPLVAFVTGRRQGGSWRVNPPLRDAAFLQIEHYQQESALKHAKTLTAFPMLAANGVAPAEDAAGNPAPVPVGPQAVLYAPPSADGSSGNWQFIEPNATSLRFLADDIKSTATELRELGRQPLTAQSGNLTVVTTAFAAQKGNSAVQAWAINLKDALEQAFVFTAMWLKADYQTEVKVNTDFDVGTGADDTFAHVLALREREEISREQTIAEAKRRNILGPDYDAEIDVTAILKEGQGGDI